ncbi:bifunctional riboflavin kinase/FAD synthetase [Sulfoacidibacillus thermotolerans]|uniref:Riboflavin biosynthesis protein n=1 Tax=Sulfoacidibacillus thermotolerans TaxID=1765684 RepID=A0A2U3DAB8_SULT2|nr:bifunctional riboflavin kinase/FAD synthetase [Sulfoacidibacillus thermotolerans]PWI58224.1 riboflavin biosynthesis protein RibF [Sulfoacidibacillus thermotolerans]
MTKPTLIQLDGSPIPEKATQRTFAIGKFDGIHIAHQAVISRAVEVAKKLHATASLFTFDPHPRFALTGDTAYERLLTPLKERARIAATLGIATTFVAQFDTRFQQQSAKEFMEHYLLPLGACHLVVGYDFRFGKNGRYTPEDLIEIGRTYNILVDVVQPIDCDGIPVSSSVIRKKLEEGDIARATRLLGRPYRVRGQVSKGDQRGREIGFPTANLSLSENYVLPKSGVYIVDVWILGEKRRAVMNIGTRPTIYEDGVLSVEVHIPDFAGDLYGIQLDVDFLHYVREERRFSSLMELQEQLARDVHTAIVWVTPIQ